MFKKITWYVYALFSGYLLLRLFTGVSRYDLGGFGTGIYFLCLIGFVLYTKGLSQKEERSWFVYPSIFLGVIVLIFLIFFIALNNSYK